MNTDLLLKRLEQLEKENKEMKQRLSTIEKKVFAKKDMQSTISYKNLMKIASKYKA